MNKQNPKSFQNTPSNRNSGEREAVKPIHEVRLGTIRAAIWANTVQNGTNYSVSLSRIYRTDDGWKRSESFGRDDLLVVGKVADLAHSWIHDELQRLQNND